MRRQVVSRMVTVARATVRTGPWRSPSLACARILVARHRTRYTRTRASSVRRARAFLISGGTPNTPDTAPFRSRLLPLNPCPDARHSFLSRRLNVFLRHKGFKPLVDPQWTEPKLPASAHLCASQFAGPCRAVDDLLAAPRPKRSFIGRQPDWRIRGHRRRRR